MSEILRINGGKPLEGEVRVSGSKNAALGILAAALLADSPCTIENLPDVSDIRSMLGMMEELGAKITFKDNTAVIDPTDLTGCSPSPEPASKMRASYYLVPVLLRKLGKAHVHLPGGCNIGERAIDETLRGWRALGATIEVKDGFIIGSVENELHGANVVLGCPSVGATINTMLLAAGAKGRTTISNAAKEPHIVDVAIFLSAMGARIKGAGTDEIRINGIDEFVGRTHPVIPDQIETGTLMIAAAATKGDVLIRGAIPVHMEALTLKLMEIGIFVESMDDMIRVVGSQPYRGTVMKTQVYPGYPTDLQQPFVSFLTTAPGESTVTEEIFENRFAYVKELEKMGASIDVRGTGKQGDRQTAYIHPVKKLTGARVEVPDLRAGAALIVAGLMAEGTTDIGHTEFIHRGYECIDKKLRDLGADVHWAEE